MSLLPLMWSACGKSGCGLGSLPTLTSGRPRWWHPASQFFSVLGVDSQNTSTINGGLCLHPERKNDLEPGSAPPGSALAVPWLPWGGPSSVVLGGQQDDVLMASWSHVKPHPIMSVG